MADQVEEMRILAASPDWHQREDAGFSIRNWMENDFDEIWRLTASWVTDPSPEVRRAVCLGCMQRKKKTSDDRVKRVITRVELLMYDGDPYVRKCCGPFVVGYLGYTYPSIVLPWLASLTPNEDENVRANIAKAFSQALGRKYPREALDILDKLESDQRRRVKSAVVASLRNVRTVYGG